MTTTERLRLEAIRRVLKKWLSGDHPKTAKYSKRQQEADRKRLQEIEQQLANDADL